MMILMVQAIAASAYVHHSELTGAEYVSFDHDRSENALPSDSKESGKSSLNDLDCHHCCHCTGILSPLVNSDVSSILSGVKQFGYIPDFPTASISPHIRPPIF